MHFKSLQFRFISFNGRDIEAASIALRGMAGICFQVDSLR